MSDKNNLLENRKAQLGFNISFVVYFSISRWTWTWDSNGSNYPDTQFSNRSTEKEN